MKYTDIEKGIFIERPNRFIAHVEILGRKETVHVKNTGRCRELLRPGVTVYVEKSRKPERKTAWDLIAVQKGKRLINMDSQAPNRLVKEWIEKGGLLRKVTKIRPEYTYGNSRIDLYAEADGKKVLIEVKGVTLEEDGVVRFPDAPSERAVKHVNELVRAVEEGYEAYVFFVIQMRGVRMFTPNIDTHPAFGGALKAAAHAGVHVVAYDCAVTTDEIEIRDEVPVVFEYSVLNRIAEPLISWYREHKRELPWRETTDPYRIWVSEIMLQQTRVEAVKPYYERFLGVLPTVKELAAAPEDRLLKLWEGLGYYNRVRNMQKAAIQIMEDHGGKFPVTYEGVRSLKGIGNYTAGAVVSFAYGLPKPAVDGNVLRVITRLTEDDSDIRKQSTKARIEKELEDVIPKGSAGDFNQGLIELGALVCVPNGQPRCGECPLADMCGARISGHTADFPVKTKGKKRRIEKRTVLVFRDGERIAIVKRKDKGLLAGLYEFPNVSGHLTMEEVKEICKDMGLMPVRIRELTCAKHIFSHVEWDMTGYEIRVDELEKTNRKGFLFIRPEEIKKEYPMPSAFEAYISWER